MEDNKLITRDQLKTYFETGKYPTESQFSDLIDSLKHKQDVLNRRELLILANSLATIDDTFIYYTANEVGNLEMQIAVSSQGEEDQLITIKDSTKMGVVRQFLLGKEPYTIKLKEISQGDLKEYDYYSLDYKLSDNAQVRRLFGNNLHTISEGFDFGELKSFRLPIDIRKISSSKKINIVNTNIKFINNTSLPIQYRVFTQYWSDIFKKEDSRTDHYDAWDNLTFQYIADLRAFEQTVRCDIYDDNTNMLLTTGYLLAWQYQDYWDGGFVEKVRNIRIECNYSVD